MSLIGKYATMNALRASRSLARSSVGNNLRFMSVITLEGETEIEKFRMINAKSILYFTATWCVWIHRINLRKMFTSVCTCGQPFVPNTPFLFSQ